MRNVDDIIAKLRLLKNDSVIDSQTAVVVYDGNEYLQIADLIVVADVGVVIQLEGAIEVERLHANALVEGMTAANPDGETAEEQANAVLTALGYEVRGTASKDFFNVARADDGELVLVGATRSQIIEYANDLHRKSSGLTLRRTA